MNNTIQLNQTRITRLHSIIDSISSCSFTPTLRKEFNKETQIYKTFNIEIAPNLDDMSPAKAERLKMSVLGWEQQLEAKLQEREVTYGVFKSPDAVLLIKDKLEKQEDVKSLFSTCTSFQQLSDKRVILFSNQSTNDLDQTNGNNRCELGKVYKINLKINFQLFNFVNASQFLQTEFQENLEVLSFTSTFERNPGQLNLGTFTNLKSLSCQDLESEFEISNLTNLTSLSIQGVRSSLKLINLPNLTSFSCGVIVPEFIKLNFLPLGLNFSRLCSISFNKVFRPLEFSNLLHLKSLSLGTVLHTHTLINLPSLTSISCGKIGSHGNFLFDNINSLKLFHSSEIEENSLLKFVKSSIVSFSCKKLFFSAIEFIECLNLETIHFENASVSVIKLESLPGLKKLGLINIESNPLYDPSLILKLKRIPQINCLNSFFPEAAEIEIEDCDFTSLKLEKPGSEDNI